MKEIKKDPFDEYIKNLPPTRKELGQAWRTAIGLQDVDGLQPSAYLYETAKKNIDGEISVDEARALIDSYYESKDGRLKSEARTEEADKVSARIAKLLSDKSFIFSTTQYISIHRELFMDIYPHAGKIRDYNISKKEWVLDGDSVSYGGAIDLRETLEYDISQERNTRTTAVFFIKYLRMLGFKGENDLFAENSWYFRNALVRANYNNIKAGIYETTEFLEKFMRNLVLDEKNELHNRDMHIGAQFLLGHADSINDPINDPIKLNEREKKVVEILRREPALTRSEMAECLGCSDSTVKRALQSMVEKGVIKRIGSNKKGEWIILNVNDNYSDKN